VVVVLGHVDHGKSSILEAIKDLKITSKESGGITQHIAAYEVEHQGKKITFIDTPGHEAFSAMRSRGANAADIAILVVAGEEGVKEQTKEAILHIKEAEIPMIVAINKIDKPEANPEKVKRELAAQDVLTESMGGKVPSIELSAKTKKGITDLLEMVLLISEMENLKVDVSKSPDGYIIESYMDSLRGPSVTLIVKEGTLKKGDVLGTDSAAGKIKILEDFQGKVIDAALPSMPAIVLGFENLPKTGESFRVFKNTEEAKSGVRKEKKPDLNQVLAESGVKSLNLVLKADVLGSIEAIREVLKDLPKDKAVLRILKEDVGDVNESDVKLAKGTEAAIVGFRVKVNSVARHLAEREKIRIKTFDVIYEFAKAVRDALERTLEPETVRTDLGRVKIVVVFKTDKGRQIVGGKVINGKITRGLQVEVQRNKEVVGKGKIIGLERDKKSAGEVLKGSECGISYEGNVRLEEGDVLQAYSEEKIKAVL